MDEECPDASGQNKRFGSNQDTIITASNKTDPFSGRGWKVNFHYRNTKGPIFHCWAKDEPDAHETVSRLRNAGMRAWYVPPEGGAATEERRS